MKDNTLTGKDVKESKLATVPSAANANALGGLALRGISQWVHVGTTGIIESQSGGITVTKLADPDATASRLRAAWRTVP